MKTDCLKGINTLRYSDIFLAMYSDNGSSCLHRNHSMCWSICIPASWR